MKQIYLGVILGGVAGVLISGVMGVHALKPPATGMNPGAPYDAAGYFLMCFISGIVSVLAGLFMTAETMVEVYQPKPKTSQAEDYDDGPDFSNPDWWKEK